MGCQKWSFDYSESARKWISPANFLKCIDIETSWFFVETVSFEILNRSKMSYFECFKLQIIVTNEILVLFIYKCAHIIN